jgi:hypothetical protein
MQHWDKHGKTMVDGDIKLIDWLKSLPERFNLPPKQEWSEEDEKDMAHIIRILDDCFDYGKHDLSKTDHENLVNKLKSLRPQPHWKPSEEQMGSLRLAIDSAKKAQMNATADILNEIYEQLKKL